MGANSTSLMGLSEIIQVRSLELSTERGVYVCLINVSHLYFKFFRHHFIGIASQLLFEEGIIGLLHGHFTDGKTSSERRSTVFEMIQ